MTDETIHKSTRTLTRQAIASYLHRVAVAFDRGGAIAVDDSVTIDPPSTTEMEIDVEHDGDDLSYELEFAWPASERSFATDAASGGAGGVWESVDVESGDKEVDDADGDAGTATATDDGTATSPASTNEAETAPSGMGTFELYEDNAGEWRWRLRHANGNVIADGGEGYSKKANAVNGIESVKQNAPGAAIEEQD